jgi:uncharacterized protein YecA (UPF0149 family)
MTTWRLPEKYRNDMSHQEMKAAWIASLARLTIAKNKKGQEATGIKPVEIKQQGRNELCQCGSGKKFKKCCKGIQ